MGIGIIGSGASDRRIRDLIDEYFSGEVQVGTQQAGFIVHTSPGIARDGTNVEEDYWIEFYGQRIHFSEQ